MADVTDDINAGRIIIAGILLDIFHIGKKRLIEIWFPPRSAIQDGFLEFIFEDHLLHIITYGVPH
jgi:hypothetical protein